MSVEKYKAQFNEAMAEFLGFMEQETVSKYSLIHWYVGLRFLLDMECVKHDGRCTYTMWMYRWRIGEIPILLKTVTISKE